MCSIEHTKFASNDWSPRTIVQITAIFNTPEAKANDQKVGLKWIDYRQTVCNIKVQSVLDNKVSWLGNATPFVTPLFL